MYKINLENSEKLLSVKTSYYINALGIAPNSLYVIFRGEATTKEATAKAIISIAYDILLTDEKMDELLEKHFIKVK